MNHTDPTVTDRHLDSIRDALNDIWRVETAILKALRVIARLEQRRFRIERRRFQHQGIKRRVPRLAPLAVERPVRARSEDHLN